MFSRRWYVPIALTAVAFAAFGLWRVAHAGGQNQGGEAGPKLGEQSLPIKQVVLFNSGVGYFQREGNVEGNSRIQLSFPTYDINDLLKSLVLQDTQGRIGTVSYDSYDPIEKTLRSFALDLNSNPTLAQILNQARGEQVEIVRVDEKQKHQPTTGTILGVEVQARPGGKDVVIPTDVLNLSTKDGLVAAELQKISRVKFLNPTLERELQRALNVLASSHDTQKKTVQVNFTGDGKRSVRVGYVVERPIWKTSYRLRMEPNGKVFLQGWAMVENTSDDDWNDVRMVLVSGKPISFKMNLYEPLYIPRPEVEPELFASLRPPVYGGALSVDNPAVPGGGGAPMPAAASPPIGGPAMGFAGGGFAGRSAGGAGAMMPPGATMPGGNLGAYGNAMAPYPQNQFGANAFNPQGNAANKDLQNLQNLRQEPLAAQNNRLTFDELQRRRQENAKKVDEAKKAGASIAGMNFKEGIQSVASAEEIGDYFQYVIDQKISLARQKSAMLPILDQNIEGFKVSIFNESVHAKYPLLGLRLKNTSGQPLTQGPISVYDGGVFAGDTRVLDLQPGEERLLSYAMDQGTEIVTKTKDEIGPEMTLKLDTPQFTAKYTIRQTKTYTMKNRSPHDRTVVLEHPIRDNWKLVEPAKPGEKTRDLYRFQVAVPAGKTISFDVVEEQAKLDAYALHANQTMYNVAANVHLKAVVSVHPEKLLHVRIEKGLIQTTQRSKETKSYVIQNLSGIDRTFKLDHVVRGEWTRLDEKGDNQKGPAVHRVELKVAKGKTGQTDITEERTVVAAPVPLEKVLDAKVQEWINDASTSPEAKAGLTKYLSLKTKLAESQKENTKIEGQLKAITEDQSRLRENLKIIPPTSEHHKRFLEKFVTQETEIETMQRQGRLLVQSMQDQTRELAAFVAALKAE